MYSAQFGYTSMEMLYISSVSLDSEANFSLRGEALSTISGPLATISTQHHLVSEMFKCFLCLS